MYQDKLWTGDYIFLIMSQTLIAFGFQMINPVLPLSLREFGSSEALIGFIMGAFTISAFIIRPFSSFGIKRVGKKNYLLLGIFICLLGALGYILTTSPLYVFYTRIIFGTGFGIATTLTATLVADIVPDSRRGEGIGFFGLSHTIAQAIGPLLALSIVASHAFVTVYIIAAASLLLALCWLKFLFNPQLVEVAPPAADHPPTSMSRFVEPNALLPGVLIMLVGICTGGILSFITLYGQELHVGNVGYFFLVNTVTIFLSRIVSGKIFDRSGHFWVLFPSAIILFFGFLLLSVASSMLTFLTAAAMYGMGMGSLQPSLQAWTMNRVTPGQRSVASATFFNSFDLGIGGGSFILGIIAQKTSYAYMYRCASCSMIVFLVIYLVYVLREKNKRQVVMTGS